MEIFSAADAVYRRDFTQIIVIEMINQWLMLEAIT